MKIALLGWGSLLWDRHEAFNKRREVWQPDGPSLKLEFSRVSESRDNALTLVLDLKNGNLCQVAYALSKRPNPGDAICDLRCRDEETLQVIRSWASNRKIDVVIWTDLANNFIKKSKFKKTFSTDAALCHIQNLNAEGKAKAAEYIYRAPSFIKTPLREALQSEPWFKELVDGIGL